MIYSQSEYDIISVPFICVAYIICVADIIPVGYIIRRISLKPSESMGSEGFLVPNAVFDLESLQLIQKGLA